MRLVTVTLILLIICIPAEALGKNNRLTESAITDMYIKAVDFTLAGNLKDGEAYLEEAYSNLKKGASPELEMKLLRRLQTLNNASKTWRLKNFKRRWSEFSKLSCNSFNFGVKLLLIRRSHMQ